MEKSVDALSDRVTVAENLVKCLQEMESRKRNLDLVRESVVERMMEIEFLRESLDKRSKDLEQREKEFDAFKEGKKRKLASEEEELSLRRQKFLNEVKMREEALDEHLVSVNEHVEWLGLAQAEVEGIRRNESKKLKEIEIQEQSLRLARETLAERERKVDLIVGTLDERITAVERREKEFNFFLEGKMREMELKEEQLRAKWEEFVKQTELVDEKFRKQEKLRNGLIERLEKAENKLEAVRANTDESLKEIEFRESVAWESVAASVNEGDLLRESIEKQLEEFEKMKSEFNSLQEDKMRELASKEQLLDAMSKEIVKDAELRNEQLIEQEESVHQLLRRLELAKDTVEGLNRIVRERFNEISLKKIELNSVIDWVERKMDEADSKSNELKEMEKRIKLEEENMIPKENELNRKEKALDLKEKTLSAWQKELDFKEREVDLAGQLNEQRLEKLEVRERSLNSLKEFTRNCFEEHRAKKRELRSEKDLVEKSAEDLKLKEEHLNHLLREIEFREKQMRDHVEGLELKQRPNDFLNAHVKIEPDDSVDLKFLVRMDGRTLQMYLNDPEKDLETMGDEIFKVLHLSSDPAKLVLDAMVGFYPPHLREGDVEFSVRRTCITLLEQLTKMSKRSIKPSVRREAIELASAWRSKMRGTAEIPISLEVLGFLLLLAAYNLASHFDKGEISSFLMMVAQHRETPELCRVLGFTESTTGGEDLNSQHCLSLLEEEKARIHSRASSTSSNSSSNKSW